MISGNIYLQAKQYSMFRKLNKDLMAIASERKREENLMMVDNVSEAGPASITPCLLSQRASIPAFMGSVSNAVKGSHNPLINEARTHPLF